MHSCTLANTEQLVRWSLDPSQPYICHVTCTHTFTSTSTLSLHLTNSSRHMCRERMCKAMRLSNNSSSSNSRARLHVYMDQNVSSCKILHTVLTLCIRVQCVIAALCWEFHSILPTISTALCTAHWPLNVPTRIVLHIWNGLCIRVCLVRTASNCTIQPTFSCSRISRRL